MTEPRRRPRITLAHVVIVIVVGIWAAAMLADFFVASYEPPASLNLAFMAILGPLVGTLLVKGDRRPDRDDGGDDQ